jgi:hypothetical protein
MSAVKKYQTWMQVSRQPALLKPVVRYWVGTAFIMACMHFGINTNRIWAEFAMSQSMLLSVVATVSSILFSPVIFQRLVGDLNLGQDSGTFNLPFLSRVALMGCSYGYVAAKNLQHFEAYSLIEVPVVLLLAGLFFELMLGRFQFFKPVPSSSNNATPMESAA